MTTKNDVLMFIKKDPEFKKELIEELMQDDEFKFELAIEVLSVPAESVGINSPGTILEYIYKNNVTRT